MPKIKKPNTTLKRSRKRSHLPALSPAARTIINERLNAMPFMQSTRDTVMASLNAAANKDAETPEVVIQSLERDERNSVIMAMPAYSQVFDNVAMKGRNKLLLDSELDSMIEDEAGE